MYFAHTVWFKSDSHGLKMCTNQLKHIEATLNNILKSNYAFPFAKPVTGVEVSFLPPANVILYRAMI